MRVSPLKSLLRTRRPDAVAVSPHGLRCLVDRISSRRRENRGQTGRSLFLGTRNWVNAPSVPSFSRRPRSRKGGETLRLRSGQALGHPAACNRGLRARLAALWVAASRGRAARLKPCPDTRLPVAGRQGALGVWETAGFSTRRRWRSGITRNDSLVIGASRPSRKERDEGGAPGENRKGGRPRPNHFLILSS